MPEVSHQKTYTKKLESDKYVITRGCCEALRIIDPTWGHCPFCGEEIKITDLETVTMLE